MERKRLFSLFTILSLLIFTSGILTAGAYPFTQTEEETLASDVVSEKGPTDPIDGLIEIITREAVEETGQDTGSEGITEPTADSETNPATETEEEPLPELPETPIPENPKGNFTSVAMGFYWAPAANAETYEVTWTHSSGSTGTITHDADDWTCEMGRCIVYEELPGDGDYTWSVAAVNEAGSAASEELSFSVQSKLRAPVGVLPSSALDNRKPLTFQWTDSGSSVTAYRVQVADAVSDRIILDKTYDPAVMNHVNGVCYMESTEYLISGSYIWRVQAQNSTSSSDWSGWTDFSVFCADCDLGTYLNTVASPVTPAGLTVTNMPLFQWQAVTGASYYQLQIKDQSGTVLLDETVSNENCTVETCTYQPELALATGGSYTWTVSVYGYGGGFWGSAEGAFSVAAFTVMRDIDFVGPEANATLDPDNKQIIWTDPGDETAVFRLGVRDSDDVWLFIADLTPEDAWCDGITCSIQFNTIPEGDDFEVVIVPYSEFNLAGNAIALSFNNH